MRFNLRFILLWLMPYAAVLGWIWSSGDRVLSLLLTHWFTLLYIAALAVCHWRAASAKGVQAFHPPTASRTQRTTNRSQRRTSIGEHTPLATPPPSPLDQPDPASLDPRSEENLSWALWCTLWCHCDVCGDHIELLDFDLPPWNGDVMAWSEHFAPIVKAAGWSMAPDRFNLLCPKCASAPPVES